MQTKPQPHMYHGIQPQWSWRSEGKPEGIVGRHLGGEQVHLCLAVPLPYGLHHLWVESPFPGPQSLPQQDICFHICMPQNLNCPQGEQFGFCPEQDLLPLPK